MKFKHYIKEKRHGPTWECKVCHSITSIEPKKGQKCAHCGGTFWKKIEEADATIVKYGGAKIVRSKTLAQWKGAMPGYRLPADRVKLTDKEGLKDLVDGWNGFAPDHKQITVDDIISEEKWKFGKDKPSSNKRRFYYDTAKNKRGMVEIRYMSAIGPRATVEKWTGRVFSSPEKAKSALDRLNRTERTDRERKTKV